MSHSIRALVLFSALGLVLAACGTDDDSEPTAAPASVENSSSSPPSEPSGSSSVAAGGGIAHLSELETMVPNDLPVYPSAYSGHVVEDTGEDVVLVMNVGGGIADALDYYADAIADQGWAVESETLAETTGEIVAYKGDRQMFVLTVTNGQETLVSVKIQPNPEAR